MRALPLVLALTLALPGCARLANSPINPLTWFGASLPAAHAQAQVAPTSLVPDGASLQAVDLRVPVEQIVALRLDPTPDGVLVTATGIAALPGAFNAGLVQVSRTSGTLTLEMRAELPAAATAGAQQITSSIMLTNQQISGVSSFRVNGRTSGLTARR